MMDAGTGGSEGTEFNRRDLILISSPTSRSIQSGVYTKVFAICNLEFAGMEKCK